MISAASCAGDLAQRLVDRGDLRRSAELFASGFEQLVVDVTVMRVMALTVHQLCDKTRTKINSEWCLAARRSTGP